jgi:hypothetical protein
LKGMYGLPDIGILLSFLFRFAVVSVGEQFKRVELPFVVFERFLAQDNHVVFILVIV